MYIEKKRIGGNLYNYLKISVRVGNKIKTKTIAYLGKDPISKSALKKAMMRIPLQKIEEMKKELKNQSSDINKQFLSEDQLKELNRIKSEFNKKITTLDEKIIEDMFRDFKTFYIYNTNAIEGNRITLPETNLLLNQNKTPEGRDLREIYDHINEKEAFDIILKNKPAITNDFIIKLHSILLKNIDKRVGGFRLHNVRVFGASFETTPAEYVKADMLILSRWYKQNKKRLHPLILASIFHEKFERIHPFYDGNGRTGRMLINLILIQNGFPPLIIENKKMRYYYDTLSTAHKSDLTKIDAKLYKPIVDFCYNQFISTYQRIFSKWG